ncbi:MAG: ribosome-associated translation inhibitor RaiA [Bacteroidetes bacterium]|nr:ribosome-associated translation inhibitor RaiA [Bacteroidota bacterium]
MKLDIQSIHFDADKKLIEYIEKKLNKLETFYDHILSGEVFLKLNNDVKDNKEVEVKLHVHNHSMFVKESSISFEAAIDMAESTLRGQLVKYKERLRG